MHQGRIFISNRSQAVRIPKEAALPNHIKTVTIVAVGNTRIISPVGESWKNWFEGASVTSDFMKDRQQPSAPQRDGL